MRRTLKGVNAELAAAVRRCNVIHRQIPPGQRPDLSGESWRELEAELDRAWGAGQVRGGAAYRSA